MLEHSAPRWPLADLLRPGRIGDSSGPAGTTVLARTPGALAELMPFKSREDILAKAVRELHGIDLPRTPRRVQGRHLVCTWSGPGRWLVETGAGAPGQDAMAGLEQSLGGIAALVQQADGRSLLRISGPKVREVLRKGVTIDLHPRGFGAGDTAITLVAGIDAQLWQLDHLPTYELLFNRSVAGSFWHWLVSAAAEFGLECAPGTLED